MLSFLTHWWLWHNAGMTECSSFTYTLMTSRWTSPTLLQDKGEGYTNLALFWQAQDFSEGYQHLHCSGSTTWWWCWLRERSPSQTWTTLRLDPSSSSEYWWLGFNIAGTPSGSINLMYIFRYDVDENGRKMVLGKGTYGIVYAARFVCFQFLQASQTVCQCWWLH